MGQASNIVGWAHRMRRFNRDGTYRRDFLSEKQSKITEK